LTKYASFLRIIYSWPTFSLGCIKTPWGDGPSLVLAAHLSRFEIMRFRLTAVLEKLT